MAKKEFIVNDLVAVNHDSDVVYRVAEVDGRNFRLIDASINREQSGWWHDMGGFVAPNYRQLNMLRENTQ